MNNTKQIRDNIFYVGVNDRDTALFENLWPLPKGVSYNSYLILDEKVVLIDTVDINFADLFFKKVDSVLGGRKIDYLVVNHMEPDHSGCIELLKSRFPDIQIIVNKRSAEMLEGFYGIADGVIVIEDGDELSIGTDILKFYLTPMVHWPETMMTYLKNTKTIFSADAFGTFGALDGGIMDSELNPEKYWDEMIRYYSNIVGKFGSSVQAALKKLNGVEIDTICSTHGPVWTQPENINKVLTLYDKLSRYEGDNGLVIVYGGMYGNTERMADAIASSAAENGVKDIIIHNTSKSHLSDIIRDIFKYKGLVIGSATYNNKLNPGVDALTSALKNSGLKNRHFAYFSGHTWADGAKRELKVFAETMKFEPVCEAIEIKQSITPDVASHAYEMGRVIAEKLK